MGRRSILVICGVILGLCDVTSCQGGDSGSVRVFSFNMDGAQRGGTWVKYGTGVTLPGDYTLCLRFNIWVFRLLTAVIYLLPRQDYDEDPISFEVYFEKVRTKYGGYGRFYPLPANLATNKWYHYCQVRDVSGGEGRVYLDGRLIVRENVTFPPDPYTRDVIIGQDEFKVPYSLSGELAQVNVWSRVLTPDLISDLAGCQLDQEGDALTWSGQWELYQVQEKRISLPELCQSVVRGRVTVPLPLLRFPTAVHVCRGLGGRIAVPSGSKEMQEELAYFEGVEECDRQWAGVTDVAEEGVWRDPFTLKAHDDLYFRANNPDGDKYQNCIRLHGKGLEDTSCEKHSCSACHTTAGATWTLRGICEEEQRMYYFSLVPEPLGFRGYGEYMVEETSGDGDDDGGEGGTWAWYNTITNITMAILSSYRENNFPIGRLVWEAKEEICGYAPGPRTLTLSPCTPDQFTCSDGSCVPFSRRCDLKFDCGDKTDESFCDIVNYPDDYRSKLPPRPASDLALSISINLTMGTLNIDTTTMLLSVSYNLRITWNDNRLTYNNLKQLTRLNTVSLDQVEDLWTPTIGFINTADIQHSKVDSDTITTILRDHNFYNPDLVNPFEVRIYRGDTNPISVSRKYSTVFTCFFNLVLYPFDIQNCYLELQILSASAEYLIFNSSNSFVEYLGPKLLVEYGIGKIDLSVETGTQYSVSKVRVELIRRYGYAMLNIYIPSLTLLIISYVTLLFRPTIFEVRVMTALTSLLVLATLFTQVSASLPKTSYFKMVDIWLLFCIVLIFFIILFHTVIDNQVDYSSFINVPGSSSTVAMGDQMKKESESTRVSSIKVNPAPDGFLTLPDTSDNNKKKTSLLDIIRNRDFGLEFYVRTSRVTMSTIFLVFNIIYWGTLTVGSGLVYYY